MSNEYFPDEIYLYIEYFEVIDSVELGLKHKDFRVKWSKQKPPSDKAFRKYRLIEPQQ